MRKTMRELLEEVDRNKELRLQETWERINQRHLQRQQQAKENKRNSDLLFITPSSIAKFEALFK